MSFEELLNAIKGERKTGSLAQKAGREPEGGRFSSAVGNKPVPRAVACSLPVNGNLREEADFVLRAPLKNYFMHELADQVGAPGIWQEEFGFIVDNILRCDSFYIEPAKTPRHRWESDAYVQRLGFATVSRSRIESYLIELCGDLYVCDTDLCDFVKDQMSFGEFVEAAAAVAPSIRLFAGEYFQQTNCQRFSLEPLILVFSLPPEVRPLAALALDRDKQKNSYSPSLSRDHITEESPDIRLKYLSDALTRAVPSMSSLVEVAKSYHIKELKTVMSAYKELYQKYMSVWINPAPEISLNLKNHKPRIINGSGS